MINREELRLRDKRGVTSHDYAKWQTEKFKLLPSVLSRLSGKPFRTFIFAVKRIFSTSVLNLQYFLPFAINWFVKSLIIDSMSDNWALSI